MYNFRNAICMYENLCENKKREKSGNQGFQPQLQAIPGSTQSFPRKHQEKEKKWEKTK